MKAIFLVAMAVAALVLVVLGRSTLALKPGGGPQGGEVLFLGWAVLAFGLTVADAASAVLLAGSSGGGAARVVLSGLAALVASVAVVLVAFALLNAASLSHTDPAGARLKSWSAIALFALPIGANVVAWLRR